MLCFLRGQALVDRLETVEDKTRKGFDHEEEEEVEEEGVYTYLRETELARVVGVSDNLNWSLTMSATFRSELRSYLSCKLTFVFTSGIQVVGFG